MSISLCQFESYKNFDNFKVWRVKVVVGNALIRVTAQNLLLATKAVTLNKVITNKREKHFIEIPTMLFEDKRHHQEAHNITTT